MKAKEAIAKIEDIMSLAYDGYGEFMTTTERYRMINSVIYSYKRSLFKKECQKSWEDRIAAIKGTQDAPS